MCPCADADAGRQHRLGTHGGANFDCVGAHVIFKDDTGCFYCGIVPVCSGCNTAGRAIAFQCIAVTIVDVGRQTFAGKIERPSGGRPFAAVSRVTTQTHAGGQEVVTIEGTDEQGQAASETYPDKDGFLGKLADLMCGGVARTHSRLQSNAHVAQLVDVNKSVVVIDD
jgi:hypothetical protein